MSYDLQQFTVTENAGPPVTHTVSFKVTDPRGVVLRDFTGANALVLETELAALTRPQRLAALDAAIMAVIALKVGP